MKFDNHYEKNNLSIPIGSILNSEVKSERMTSDFVRKNYKSGKFQDFTVVLLLEVEGYHDLGKKCYYFR